MKKKLVVDDDKICLLRVRQVLENEYSLVLVKSGREALSYLNGNTCDLILLDYEMPSMSGVEVLEAIRRDPKTKDIPVIFLTGNNDPKNIYAALALKPDGYLLKPVDTKELRQRIAQILNDF